MMGMNNIDLLYEPFKDWEGTDWRPTMYIKNEWMDKKDGLKSMKVHLELGIPCYISLYFLLEITSIIPHTWPCPVRPIMNDCWHNGSNISNGHAPDKWHLPHLCCYASTANMAAQIAVLEGADEIVFLGCDLGYVWSNSLQSGDLNHFHPDYRNYDMFPVEERDATLIHMHEIIKRECEDRNIKVWNATVGGLLEVYERKSIEEIING